MYCPHRKILPVVMESKIVDKQEINYFDGNFILRSHVSLWSSTYTEDF